jgi:hypothetical protein
MIDQQQEPVCARCRRPVCTLTAKKRGSSAVLIRKWWPEGAICVACYTHALDTHGVCPGCGVDRLLPGRNEHGDPICTDCAGGLGDFTCPQCGREGHRWTTSACARCVLTDRLTIVFDNGTGTINPDLKPLYDHLSTMSRPRAGLTWLRKPHVITILGALARADVPLTHEGLATLQPWRSADYVRDLLMECGTLPRVDRFLLMFQRWLPDWLATIENPQHRALLTRYATWHVQRRLRQATQDKPLTSYGVNNARSRLRTSHTFLTELAAHGNLPAECTQSDIDRWFATTTRMPDEARAFLRWCIQRHELPRLTLPQARVRAVAPMAQAQRVAFIRQVLEDDTMPAGDRVLALLILLYAQPLQTIARLTVQDVFIAEDSGEVSIRLGEPPSPVPEPFAAILTDYLNTRPRRTSSTDPTNSFLFPGRRAAQPMHTTSLRLRLRNLGLPSLDARTAAIRGLIRDAPPFVVARMLGYHPNTAERLAIEAGVSWQRYASGDHTRQGGR